MNPYEELSALFVPKKKGSAALIIVSILAAISIAASAAFTVLFKNEPIEMTAQTPDGEYATLLIQEIDEAFAYSDEQSYYPCIASDGYFYVVSMTEKRFKSDFYELYEYAFSQDENTRAPDPVPLTGVTCEMVDDVITYGAEYWESDEDEFVYYFGNIMLDGTQSPVNYGALGFGCVGGVLFIAALGMLFARYKVNSQKNRSIARLESMGETADAYSELGDPGNLQFANGGVVFGKTYLFCYGAGAIYRYDDLLWCYKNIQRVNYIPVSQSAIVRASDGATVTILSEKVSNDGTGECDRVLEQIAARNPSVLAGFSAENISAYNEARKLRQNG